MSSDKSLNDTIEQFIEGAILFVLNALRTTVTVLCRPYAGSVHALRRLRTKDTLQIKPRVLMFLWALAANTLVIGGMNQFRNQNRTIWPAHLFSAEWNAELIRALSASNLGLAIAAAAAATTLAHLMLSVASGVMFHPGRRRATAYAVLMFVCAVQFVLLIGFNGYGIYLRETHPEYIIFSSAEPFTAGVIEVVTSTILLLWLFALPIFPAYALLQRHGRFSGTCFRRVQRVVSTGLLVAVCGVVVASAAKLSVWIAAWNPAKRTLVASDVHCSLETSGRPIKLVVQAVLELHSSRAEILSEGKLKLSMLTRRDEAYWSPTDPRAAEGRARDEVKLKGLGKWLANDQYKALYLGSIPTVEVDGKPGPALIEPNKPAFVKVVAPFTEADDSHLEIFKNRPSRCAFSEVPMDVDAEIHSDFLREPKN